MHQLRLRFTTQSEGLDSTPAIEVAHLASRGPPPGQPAAVMNLELSLPGG